jgi:hypothetical protein
MAHDIGLKHLSERLRIAPEDTTASALQQNHDTSLSIGLLCADGERSVTRFYQLVADVLSSIDEAKRLGRAA